MLCPLLFPQAASQVNIPALTLLLGANKLTDNVVCDGQFITSRGMGTCIDFGLALLARLTDQDKAQEIGKKIVYYR